MKEKLLSALHSLKNINVPMIGFIAVTAHIVSMGAQIGDALALMAICGLYGYKAYLTKNANDSVTHLEKELSTIRNDIGSLKIKTLQSPSPDKPLPKRMF